MLQQPKEIKKSGKIEYFIYFQNVLQPFTDFGEYGPMTVSER